MIPVNTIYKTTLWLLLVLPLHFNQILAAAPSQEFQRLDKDRNGVLEGKELIGIPADLFTQLDSNADGKISAAEDERHFGRPNGNFTVTELQYANNKNPRQSLDLYQPNEPSKAKLPLIVFIHGGLGVLEVKQLAVSYSKTMLNPAILFAQHWLSIVAGSDLAGPTA